MMRPHRWLGSVVLTATLSLWSPRDAHACSCANDFYLTVLPDARLPPNGRVLVRGSDAAHLEDGHGHVIPAKLEELAGWTVLTPEAPLVPRSEVHVVFPADLQGYKVFGGPLTVTEAPDRDAPKLHAQPTVTIETRCTGLCGSCPWVDLDAGDDVGSPRDGVFLAIWRPDRRGRFDTTRPPDALVPRRGSRTSFRLGTASMCDPPDWRLVRKGGENLAVALIDSAGQRSDLLRLTYDTKRGKASVKPLAAAEAAPKDKGKGKGKGKGRDAPAR